MLKYFAIFRVGFLTLFAYKGNVILMCVSNLLYVVIVYFLWKSIYESTDGILNGMTFEQAFIYLALTSTLFNTFKTWTEWAFSAKVRSGDILLDLARPISISLLVFCESSSRALFNLVWIALPFAAVIALGFNTTMIAVEQIPVALLALIIAYVVNFQIDYITGIVTFYTQSVWGLSLTKESIVLLLSGVVVPLAFFPPALMQILYFTPFPYIYHVPTVLLIDGTLQGADIVRLISGQILWVIILSLVSSRFFRFSLKRLVVNGG